MTGPSDITDYVRPRFDLPKPLVLVGLMGVGKTTVGRRLADHFSLPFRDADEEIEKAAGQSIANIFSSLGEANFRDGEHRVILRLIDEGPQVLATGGGAFMHAQTRAALKDKAIVVWLKTDLKVLARRVANKPHRPLLKDRDPMDVLREHETNRYPFYAEAHLTVETGDQSHARSVDLVLEALKTYLDTHK
ncbi:shikimate kinase [Asticcacaulis sp. ZE23SCel15]|uniref:shikimate kinase n=1 Tax=Asticcacaulis sp. ZE23SCel15 TaxID=3059027 RepID=UPI00265F4BAF|nr:shikimate kinase [Asticcacaulis sp. ZE23SCel15]WKL56200.1 shikimate kinase [Asticcacaulis sp. ZE23SCel15]